MRIDRQSDLHELLSDEPRYVDLCRNHDEHEERKRLFAERTAREDAEWTQIQQRYEADVDRALSAEEIPEKPERPKAHLTHEQRGKFRSRLDFERKQLDDEEADIIAESAGRLYHAITARDADAHESMVERLGAAAVELREQFARRQSLYRDLRLIVSNGGRPCPYCGKVIGGRAYACRGCGAGDDERPIDPVPQLQPLAVIVAGIVAEAEPKKGRRLENLVPRRFRERQGVAADSARITG